MATGDGGAWLAGDQARAAAGDAMIIPVVTGDVNAGAVQELIALCVSYHRLRTPGPAPGVPATARAAPATAQLGPPLRQRRQRRLSRPG